jgi:Mn-containing catalase
MADPDQHLQQVMQYTAQSINWMRQSFGAELSADTALECASRMALAAAMLNASENNMKAESKPNPDQESKNAVE